MSNANDVLNNEDYRVIMLLIRGKEDLLRKEGKKDTKLGKSAKEMEDKLAVLRGKLVKLQNNGILPAKVKI